MDRVATGSTKLVVALSVGLLTLSQPKSASADDSGDLQTLLAEPVVTTASKSAESGSTAPATSTVLTAEDIRAYGIRTIAEAIDFLSLSVATSPNGRGGEVGARGVLLHGDRGDHVLLLLNGHAINEALSGSERLDRGAGIPIESIDHIEVIVGPGSVLYGSNAMLGVINVITKRAKDFEGMHLIAEGELSSLRLAAGAGYSFVLWGSKGEATAEAEYYGQRGPDLSFDPENVGNDPATGLPTRFSRSGPGTGVWGGVAHRNAEDSPAGVARILWGNFQLTLRGAIDTQSRPLSPLSFDDAGNQEVERWASFDLTHRATLSTVVQWTTRVYGDLYGEDSSVVSPQVAFCRVPGVNCKFLQNGRARGLGAELQGSFDWFRDSRFVSIVGFDGNLRSVASEAHNYDADTGILLPGEYGHFDHSDVPFGAYAQQQWEPTTWLGLNAGARVDRDERFPAVVSPRFAADAKPWTGGTVRLIYAEAFRAPSWDETSYSDPTRILPDALRPEKVRSVELSVEERFSGQRLFFGIFRSGWQDLVQLQTLDPADRANALLQHKTDLDPASTAAITQMRNVAAIENYGLNCAFEGMAARGTVHYGMNGTAAVAYEDDPVAGRQVLTVAPRLFGNARIAYDLPAAGPTIAIASQYLGARIADGAYSGNFAPLPVVVSTVSLRATISGIVPWVKGLSYRAIGGYTFGDRAPYVVGPIQQATSANPSASLLPLQRQMFTVALRYDF